MNSKRIKIGLLGAQGRMGTLIDKLSETEFSDSLVVSVRVNRGDTLDLLSDVDVVIDVSSPQRMHELAFRALDWRNLPSFVIGSTGWTEEERKALDRLSTKTSVLLASNFSVGVFALSQILKQYSGVLQRLGYSPVLVEKHHSHKKDSPSGTAISLQRCIDPERPAQVQTHSIRAGEVIGEHDVTFYSAGDRIHFGHMAQDRSIFARGALQVSQWIHSHQIELKKQSRILGVEDYFENVMRSTS